MDRIPVKYRLVSGKVFEVSLYDEEGGYRLTDEERRNGYMITVGFNDPHVCQQIAIQLGKKYDMADDGAHVSPRYSIIMLPQVGEVVSYGFNGDYYPCGKIVAVSDSRRRVVAEDERGQYVFWRRKKSTSWKYNQTWGLMRGIHDRRSPEF